MDSVGISNYYENLPRGGKEVFLAEVATALGQSVTNIRVKMKNGRWAKLEKPVLEKIIKERTV